MRWKIHVRFTPKSGHVRCTSLCLLWANSGHRTELADKTDFGVDLHWRGQRWTWPCYPVFFDLIQKPLMKTACQHPLDTIAAPENPPLLNVSVLHGHDVIPSSLYVSRTNRQVPHFLEPRRRLGVIL